MLGIVFRSGTVEAEVCDSQQQTSLLLLHAVRRSEEDGVPSQCDQSVFGSDLSVSQLHHVTHSDSTPAV